MALASPVVEQDFSPAIADPPPVIEQAAAADESVEAQALPIVALASPVVEQDFSPACETTRHEDLESDDADEPAELQVFSLAGELEAARALEEHLVGAVDASRTAEQPADTPEQRLEPAEPVRAFETEAAGEVDPFGLTGVPAGCEMESARDGAAIGQAPEIERGGFEQLALAAIEDDSAPALVRDVEAGTAAVVGNIAASGDADDTGLAAADASPAADQADREHTPSLVREASDAVHAAFVRALGPLHAFVAHVATSLKTRSPAATLDLNADIPATGDVETVEAIPESAPNTAGGLGSVAVGGDASAATPATLTPAPSLAASQVETVVAQAAEGTAAPAQAETSERGGSSEDEWIDITPLIAPSDKSQADGSAAERIEEKTQSGPSGPDSNAPEIAAEADAEKEKRRRRRRRRVRTGQPAPAIDPAFAGLDGQLLASAIAALRVDIARLREEALTTGPAGSAATSQASAQVHRGNALVGQNDNGNENGNGNGHNQVETTKQEPEPVQLIRPTPQSSLDSLPPTPPLPFIPHPPKAWRSPPAPATALSVLWAGA